MIHMEEEKKKKMITLTLSEIKDGTCNLMKTTSGDSIAVCREDNKIKIFELAERKKERR